jgi:hypothetical protein
MKRTLFIVLSILVLFIGLGATIKVRSHSIEEDSSSDRWEYLVVSTSNNVNFSAPSTGSMRKEANGFQRENFVLEQNMDKLGEKGWQLVSVATSEGERGPVYYFKRRK